MASHGGLNGRRPHGTEDVPSRILQELTAQNLSARSLAHESTANREESGSAAAAAAAKRTPATKLAAHAGLLCADTYNLHAAMWARRDTEPQAAIFLQVCLGKLPPSTFDDFNKLGMTLYRSLSTVAVGDRVQWSSIEEKLPGLLPGLTAVKMGPLRAAVLADAGSGGIRLKAFEPPSKEPCDGKPLTPSQIEVQKLLLKTALTLRNDVVESIRRTAVHHVMELGRSGRAASHADESTAGDSRLPPSILRGALLRFDSAMPEHVLTDHIVRVYGIDADASAAAAAAAREAGEDADADDESGLSLAAICARLFTEQLKRTSARTHPEVRLKLEAALRGSGGKGKKAKGGAKKAKGAEVVAKISLAEIAEAVLRADPGRPQFEVEWLATTCLEAARKEAIPADVATLAADEAPLEGVIEALGSALIQPTVSFT